MDQVEPWGSQAQPARHVRLQPPLLFEGVVLVAMALPLPEQVSCPLPGAQQTALHSIPEMAVQCEGAPRHPLQLELEAVLEAPMESTMTAPSCIRQCKPKEAEAPSAVPV